MAEVEHNAGRNQGALCSRKQHGVFTLQPPRNQIHLVNHSKPEKVSGVWEFLNFGIAGIYKLNHT